MRCVLRVGRRPHHETPGAAPRRALWPLGRYHVRRCARSLTAHTTTRETTP